MNPAATLALLAVFCAGIWRFEVLLRGPGLAWTTYLHLAPFVALVVFLVWLLNTPTARLLPRRWALGFLSVLWALLSFWHQERALRGVFGAGDLSRLPDLIVGTFALPIGAFLVGRPLGYPLRWRWLPISVLLVCGHPFIGAWVAGSSIEAIKGGWSVLFVVFGLGLPWIDRQGTNAQKGS